MVHRFELINYWHILLYGLQKVQRWGWGARRGQVLNDGKGNDRKGLKGLSELLGVQIRLYRKLYFYFKQLLENIEYLG